MLLLKRETFINVVIIIIIIIIKYKKKCFVYLNAEDGLGGQNIAS